MCLVEMMDKLHRPLRRGRFCYLASFGVAGEFDNASHSQPKSGLVSEGADAHTRRAVHNWLSPLTFQVRMVSQAGVH